MIKKGRLNSNTCLPCVLLAGGAVFVTDALYGTTNFFIPMKLITLLILSKLSSFCAARSVERHNFTCQERLGFDVMGLKLPWPQAPPQSATAGAFTYSVFSCKYKSLGKGVLFSAKRCSDKSNIYYILSGSGFSRYSSLPI